MKYSFDQTEEDFIAFHIYYSWDRPEKRLTRILWTSLPVPIYVLWIHKSVTQYDVLDIALVIFGLAISIFLTPYVRWRLRRRARNLLRSGKNIDMIGQRTLEFTDEFLLATTTQSSGHMKWTSFECLKETRDHLFLFQTVNQAIVLPKRIFQSTDELNQIKVLLSSKVTAANKQNNDVGNSRTK